MKIYIAARYDRRFELRKLDEELRKLGHEPTSQWVHNAEESLSKSAAALMDVADVERADVVVFHGEAHGSLNRGGGRWFEFGLAYGLGKECHVVLGPDGGHESVFTHLPGVVAHLNHESFLRHMVGR